MSETITRVRNCDSCGNDLTIANRAYVWHFIVSGAFTPTTLHIMYDPHPEPPDDMHFCNEECLRGYFCVRPVLPPMGRGK